MKQFFLMTLASLFIFGCSDDDDENTPAEMAEFTVTIENVVTPKPIFQSGIFTIPVNDTAPAPLLPGDVYEFTVNAGPVVLPEDGGTRLSFITKFVPSNDLFFAPDIQGISLYDAFGRPIGAKGPENVTDEVLLWDAGTEVNEATGGPNQKPQQDPDAKDQGINENGVVTRIENNKDVFGNIVPDTEEVIKVTIENVSDAKFLVRIENVSNENTLMTPALGEGTSTDVPVSPGVYAVHTSSSPFFDESMTAFGAGLVHSSTGVENIAEDGFPEALLTETELVTGLIVPFSPGVWAVHSDGSEPLYRLNTEDYGEGLEGIAEDGTPILLTRSLSDRAEVSNAAQFNIPVGDSGPGLITPGNSYDFTFTASEGDHLSFATKFVQSNDWFYAFPPSGLSLFENGTPVEGDVTENVFLFDAGTESNEYPGAGSSQWIRQARVNSGAADTNTNVRLIDPSKQRNVPNKIQAIKVTISSEVK